MGKKLSSLKVSHENSTTTRFRSKHSPTTKRNMVGSSIRRWGQCRGATTGGLCNARKAVSQGRYALEVRVRLSFLDQQGLGFVAKALAVFSTWRYSWSFDVSETCQQPKVFHNAEGFPGAIRGILNRKEAIYVQGSCAPPCLSRRAS